MKPTIGRGVTIKNVYSNGIDEHAGLITRVWGNGDTVDGPVGINVCVFPDMGATLSKSSVQLYDSREQAERFLATQSRPGPVVAFWPDRVPDTPRTEAASVGAVLQAA